MKIKTILGATGLAVALFAAPAAHALDAAAGEALAKKEACLKCHGIDKKKEASSLKSIAKKYAGKPDGEAKILAQITTAAIDAGIARAALRDTLVFVREHARPWIDSGLEKASDDPLTIIQIGRLSIQLDASEALLERAGKVMDSVRAAPDEDGVARASVAVAKAKVLTTEIALEASTRLFELGGTRSSLARHNHDRHWRNARVHTLHDPVRWKYHVVGNWLLNGINPPRHDWS